jgi:hypothetical protein
MKYLNQFVFLCSIFCFTAVHGGTESAMELAQRLQAIKTAAQAFHAQKQLGAMVGRSSARAFTNVNCPTEPTGPACVDAYCAHLSSYYCDDQSELTEVAAKCKGNIGGGCINAYCGHLSSYYCDDKSELDDVAATCKGNLGGGCINAVCSRLSSYYCDDKSELDDIAGVCKGIDGSCIDSVCSKLSSYYCDDLSELKNIAQNCAP